MSFPKGIYNDTNSLNVKEKIPFGNDTDVMIHDEGHPQGAPLPDETSNEISTTSNNLPTTSNLDTRVAELQALRKQDKVQYELKALLAGVPTIYDELPVKARGAALDAIIHHALQEANARFDFDEQDAFIVQANGEGVDSLPGAGVTPQMFIDTVLAQNKVLRVAMPPRTPGSDDAEKASTPRTITANPNGLQGHNEVASLNRRMRERAGR